MIIPTEAVRLMAFLSLDLFDESITDGKMMVAIKLIITYIDQSIPKLSK